MDSDLGSAPANSHLQLSFWAFALSLPNTLLRRGSKWTEAGLLGRLQGTRGDGGSFVAGRASFRSGHVSKKMRLIFVRIRNYRVRYIATVGRPNKV